MPLLERTGPTHIEVERGEIVAVLGAPGSGKTRLALELAFLARPLEGQVLFHGRDPMPRRRWATLKRPREVALLVQNAEDQLFARSVFDDVAFGPRHLGLSMEEIEARVDRALENVRMNPALIRDRSPFALSGGERRRVALAGVLAMEPEILILDEPVSSLDAGTRERFSQILAPLREKSGIVWFTASAREASLADRSYLLRDGRSLLLDGKSGVWEDWRELASAGIELAPIYELAEKLESRGFLFESASAASDLERAIVANWRERNHDR